MYASDRFGMRNRLISLNAKINYEVLHGAVFTDSAIEGKDGWLPIFVAAASGYAAGKLAKKAISKGINFAFKTPSLTKRRSDYDDICMA